WEREGKIDSPKRTSDGVGGKRRYTQAEVDVIVEKFRRVPVTTMRRVKGYLAPSLNRPADDRGTVNAPRVGEVGRGVDPGVVGVAAPPGRGTLDKDYCHYLGRDVYPVLGPSGTELSPGMPSPRGQASKDDRPWHIA